MNNNILRVEFRKPNLSEFVNLNLDKIGIDVTCSDREDICDIVIVRAQVLLAEYLNSSKIAGNFGHEDAVGIFIDNQLSGFAFRYLGSWTILNSEGKVN